MMAQGLITPADFVKALATLRRTSAGSGCIGNAKGNYSMADANDFTILAIDPGLTGALAFSITPHFDRVSVYDMPVVNGEVNAPELRDMIAKYRPNVAIIERVNPMPRDGVRQAWRFSAAYTTARVVALLQDIPTSLVTPAQWKKEMKVKGGPEGKEQCRALAIRMFPSCAASFARKKDAGRAEAALLAMYASNKFRLNPTFKAGSSELIGESVAPCDDAEFGMDP